MVAVTRQVPAWVAVSTPERIAHPCAVPLATWYAMVPVPDPPEVTNVRGVPKVPAVDVIDSSAWLAFAIVMVVWIEDFAL